MRMLAHLDTVLRPDQVALIRALMTVAPREAAWDRGLTPSAVRKRLLAAVQDCLRCGADPAPIRVLLRNRRPRMTRFSDLDGAELAEVTRRFGPVCERVEVDRSRLRAAFASRRWG